MEKKKPPRILRLKRVSTGIVEKAADMSRPEARALIGYYFRVRLLRQSSTRRLQILKNGNLELGIEEEDHPMLNYARLESNRLLDQIVQAIDIWSDVNVPSRWAKSFEGIGPLVGAGLNAYIDPEKGRTVSQVWRYAGFDPSCKWWWKEDEVQAILKMAKLKFGEPDLEVTVRWIAKQINVGYHSFLRRCYIPSQPEITWRSLRRGIKRLPWNKQLKQICYHLGMVFLRNRNNKDHFYGQAYDYRKKFEEDRNEKGYYKEMARERLATRFTTIDREGSPYLAFIQDKIPPHHVDKIARRWAIKLFLEHFHQVSFYERYGMLPPRSYRVSMLGGQDRYVCPNWPYTSSRPYRKDGYLDE
jgi:hypothetical protein